MHMSGSSVIMRVQQSLKVFEGVTHQAGLGEDEVGSIYLVAHSLPPLIYEVTKFAGGFKVFYRNSPAAAGSLACSRAFFVSTAKVANLHQGQRSSCI